MIRRSDAALDPRRRAARLVAIFISAVAVFVLLLTIAYSLPQSAIRRHLVASLPLLTSEGHNPRPLFDSPAYQLDNFTDALMLDTALVTTPGGPLRAALASYNGYVVEQEGLSTILALEKSLEGRARPGQYARYWHGYQVFLRPALVFLPYGGIRYLNMLALAALCLFVALRMHRRAGVAATVAFVMSLALTGFYVVPMSLQFSGTAYLMLLATLVVLMWPDQKRFSGVSFEFFFVVGMLTAFLDLLTAPLLTLGLPLAVTLVLAGLSDPNAPLKTHAWSALKHSVAWSVGYLGAWVAKIVLAAIVVGPAVVEAATSAFTLRAGLDSAAPPVVDALLNNLLSLFPLAPFDPGVPGLAKIASPGVFLVAALAVAALSAWLVRTGRLSAIGLRDASPVLLVVPLPYLWFAVASNHSVEHYWFTYRIQAIAVFAIVYFVISGFRSGREDRAG